MIRYLMRQATSDMTVKPPVLVKPIEGRELAKSLEQMVDFKTLLRASDTAVWRRPATAEYPAGVTEWAQGRTEKRRVDAPQGFQDADLMAKIEGAGTRPVTRPS